MRLTAFFAIILATTLPAGAETVRSDLGNAAVLHKLYPPRALAAGEHGVVGFEVALDKAGHPVFCQVTQTSGFPRLDEETCTVITQHAVFGTNEGVGSRSSMHKGTIAWVLPAGVTPSKQAASMVAPPEKKICRRFPVTGTLSGFERVCMTPSQWKEARADARENYEELQGKGFTAGQ